MAWRAPLNASRIPSLTPLSFQPIQLPISSQHPPNCFSILAPIFHPAITSIPHPITFPSSSRILPHTFPNPGPILAPAFYYCVAHATRRASPNPLINPFYTPSTNPSLIRLPILFLIHHSAPPPIIPPLPPGPTAAAAVAHCGSGGTPQAPRTAPGPTAAVVGGLH